jgi:hypothetical protein
MLGRMLLLWFLLLHIPRALGMAGITGAPHNPNERSSAIIARQCAEARGFAQGTLRAGAARMVTEDERMHNRFSFAIGKLK